MRASEEQRKHSEKHGELLDEAERLQGKFLAIVGEETIPVIIRGSQDEEVVHAYAAAMKALLEHIANEPDLVRNYRVTSIDGTEEYAQFRCQYLMAPQNAFNRMREQDISRYALDEQLPDASWVPYQLGRGNNSD